MKPAPKLDGRRASDLDAELERRALAVLSGDGRSPPLGNIAKTILAVAARIGEEATKRLDMAPAKQADNFYTAAGIGRDPARPATVPVAFALTESAKAVLSAPAQTQLMVDADGPVIFETETRIDLAPGTVAALRGLDARTDAIFIPSPAVMAAKLPRAEPVARRLRSGAAAGATKIQIDPVAGLEPGALLQLGSGEAARQYVASAIEGDLVTVEPALELGLAENEAAIEVTDFAPFGAGARNHQSHSLYLGHSKLLDVPSAVTITVTGTTLPADAEWSWWGQLGEDDPPAWQALNPNDGAALSFTKAKGKPAKKKIGNAESLWLRARLPGKSASSARAQDVRLAIGDASLCTSKREDRCLAHADAMNVGYEAIANTTPIVTNSAFHPFGREPRLYDSFYIGSDEAFSKPGAEVSLCFEFGGADLGPLTMVSDSLGAQVFGIGTGGVAYRADFRSGAASLLALPPPPDQSMSSLASKAAIDAWIREGQVLLAAASTGAVHLAMLAVDSKLDPASVRWTRLPLETQVSPPQIRQVAIADGFVPTIYALEAREQPGAARDPTRKPEPAPLWKWPSLVDGGVPDRVAEKVSELVAVPEAPGGTVATSGAHAVLWIEEGPAGHRLSLRPAAPGLPFDSPWLQDSNFPQRCRTAWLGPEQGTPASTNRFLYIAGYGGNEGKAELRLVKYKIGATSYSGHWQSDDEIEPLPASFNLANSPPSGPIEQRLQLSVALETPRHYHLSGTMLVGVEEPDPIGADDNPARMIVTSAGKNFVQRSNAGLRYRTASPDGGALAEHRVSISAQPWLASAAQLPPEPVYAVFGTSAPQGSGYTFSSDSGTYRMLVGLTGGNSGSGPEAPPSRFLVDAGPTAPAEVVSPQRIELVLAPPEQVITVHLIRTDAKGKLLSEGIWELESVPPSSSAKSRSSTSTSSGSSSSSSSSSGSGSGSGSVDKDSPPEPITTKWKSKKNLPQVDDDESLDYVLLGPAGVPISLIEALALTKPSELTALLDAGALFADTEPPTPVTGTEKVGSYEVLLLDHDLVENKTLRLFSEPQPWRDLGPSQPANPALSWEYWNGESWWALAAGELVDRTADFQQSGGVFFTVPPDIQPTDVAGRTEHWLRVRLAGGDYGEAKVSVVSQPGAKAGTTEQVVVRDVSTVRAPYITSLKLGYCAIAPVRPEIVLTEDSLGPVDQTSANEAGLAFPVFTPVAELMNPVSAAEATAQAAAGSESCDDPCPEPEAGKPGPCDAPGVYESCDSPCIAPDGYRSPAGEEAKGFVRGLMIGFSEPFAGDTISLYVDADPAGPPVELAADILQGGRYVPVALVKDSSYGLTESGILTLALPGPPDMSNLLGAGAHWLRLRPKGDSSTWVPRLRGLHLNGVRARSIETRAMETIGQSIGVADQEFNLTEPPVDPRSLELRIRELLSEEEKADPDLDVVTYAAGPAGDWVRWLATEDLIETGDPQRVFVLDAESGLIRFGNGATGRIPPLGADILAALYAHVTGAKANGVVPGQELQSLSPLAGVEKVIALDNAAGGSDSEALESARLRAAAKVRHGGRILSRADLEDYAPTLSPAIAQVRAEKWRGAIRLIVAMKGAEARPSPAQLRGFGAAIGDVSGYGITRPGGLKVVAPRLLPLAVDLVLRPRTPDLFAEAAVQAKAALIALFDPATGNHDGRGWPMGRLPDAQDIAAALVPIEALALPESVTLERADKEIAAERALPESIPSDVLVRLDASDIALERAQEQAA